MKWYVKLGDFVLGQIENKNNSWVVYKVVDFPIVQSRTVNSYSDAEAYFRHDLPSLCRTYMSIEPLISNK